MTTAISISLDLETVEVREYELDKEKDFKDLSFQKKKCLFRGQNEKIRYVFPAGEYLFSPLNRMPHD